MFGSAYTDIIQTVLSVDKYEKREKLKEIILSDNSGGIAVFVKNEMIADFLSSFFSRYHIAQSVAFHGHCVETLDRFRSGRLEVLFTTSDAVLGLGNTYGKKIKSSHLEIIEQIEYSSYPYRFAECTTHHSL